MSIRKGLALPIYEAELLSENYRMKVAMSEDAQEGPRAFLEKRDPVWRAR
jgi:enoyl-CoA hydratase/carnithine racemase